MVPLLGLVAGVAFHPGGGAAPPASGDPPMLSSDCTIRGVKDWKRVLDVVGSRLESARKAGDAARKESLCVLLDVDAPVRNILGEAGGPLQDFLRSRPAAVRVGVMGAGREAVATSPPGSDPEAVAAWFRQALESRPEGRAAWGPLFSRGLEPAILQGLGWLREAKEGGVLLVVTTRMAAVGSEFRSAARAARDGGTTVIVAGPEAPYATPPRVWMTGGGVSPANPWLSAQAVACDTRTPDVNLLTAQNVGAVHTWDRRLGDPWIPEESLKAAAEAAAAPGEEGDLDSILEVACTFREWPESSPTDHQTFPECTGFPSIPSGFGYWHLTRLASLTGGRYLVLSRRRSRCPFKVNYDARRLAEMSPSLETGEARSAGWGELDSSIRPLVDAGILLDWQVRGSSGGVVALDGTEGRAGLSLAFNSRGACRREAEALAAKAGLCAATMGALDGLRARLVRESGRTPADVRLRGAVDAYRVLTSRAKYHLMARAATLQDASASVFSNGSFIEVVLRSRLCRFWNGADAAKGEVARNQDRVPSSAREAFTDALAVTRSVEEEWSGTPIGAVARSGALWDYCSRMVVPDTKGGSSGGAAGGDIGAPHPAPVPTSGSGGTGE